MIKTGLREIKKYLTKKGISTLNKENLELHYVKPFPPNLYLEIQKLCGNLEQYPTQKELKIKWNLKAKTNILLKENEFSA
jgi:hypothetical protein